MAQELNKELPIQAQKLLIEAALAMTRLRRPARKAVILVMLDGLTQPEAGRRVKMKKQAVNRALRIVRDRMKEVEAYFESLP